MKKILHILNYICCLSMLQIAGHAQQMEKSSIDVQHISLDLHADISAKKTWGKAMLSIRLTESTNTIKLDAAFMQIHSCTMEDKKLQFQYDSSDADKNLQIVLPHWYKKNETIQISIDYTACWLNETDPNSLGGSNGRGIRYFNPSFTEPRKRKQLWSLADYTSNRYWFPGNDVINDLRTSEIKITVHQSLTAISNGALISIKNNPDQSRTFHYRMDIPHPNYQTSIVAGEYSVIKNKFNATEIYTYCYPDEADATRASIERLTDMFRFYDSLGLKYPFKTYTQVFVQDLPWGMHGIGASTLSENMVDDAGTHRDFLYLWDGLEAEALCYQWFGSLVPIESWKDLWLIKGLSRYFDGLYCAYKNGTDEYLLYNHFTFNVGTAIGDWKSKKAKPIVRNPEQNDIAFTSSNESYFKAAAVVHMLHRELGDQAFFDGIQRFLNQNAGKPTSTEAFKNAMEHACGRPLDWFFNQWINHTGIPVFKTLHSYDEEKKQLTLQLQQTQVPDSSMNHVYPAFFEGKMKIALDNEVKEITLLPKANNTFTFTGINKRPLTVIADYQHTWIKESKDSFSVSELIQLLHFSKDIIAKRTAGTQLIKLLTADDLAENIKLEITEAICKGIESTVYWRLKYALILQLQNVWAQNKPALHSEMYRRVLSMLLTTISNEKAWTKMAAINMLGDFRDSAYSNLFISQLYDESDRVTYAAAIALGKTKSKTAFSELVALNQKPSWKNQSLIASLKGLKELGDTRAGEIALNALKDVNAMARWTLAVPIWDFRLAAAETLASLKQTNEAMGIVLTRFKQSVIENDLNDMFNNALIATTLADAKGQEIFDMLKAKFIANHNILSAVSQLEATYHQQLKTNN